MNNFEKIKSMNIDEFVDWIEKYGMIDESPWIRCFSETFCDKCESVIGHYKDSDRELEFTWCELNEGKCKFFEELDKAPDYKQIIKMWLESECNE